MTNHTLEPVVGMAATKIVGTDRYPYTISSITGKKGNRTITLTRDDHTPDENHSYEYGGTQSYSYTTNPNGNEEYIQEKNWVRENTYKLSWKNKSTGRLRKATSGAICLGSRRYYQDPSF